MRFIKKQILFKKDINNNLLGITPTFNFEIPLFLESNYENIGIYTNYLQSSVYNGEGLLGKNLTINQIEYILNVRPDINNYANLLISQDQDLNIPIKSIAEYVQDWWDQIGKFENSNNAIKIEQLIMIEARVLSISKKFLSPPSSLNIKSITLYNGNEIDLDFRIFVDHTYEYIININGNSIKYTPQKNLTQTQLVNNIATLISNDPKFKLLGISANYYERQRAGKSSNSSFSFTTITDRFIKLKANKELLNYNENIIQINNLTTAQTASLKLEFLKPLYNLNYNDSPALPNACIVKQVLIAQPYTIYSSITTGLSGNNLNKFYVSDFLKHEYSAATPNLGLNKQILSDFFSNRNFITGITTNRLNIIKGYDSQEPFKVGVNNITQLNNQFTAYTIDNINYVTYSGTDLFTTYFFISDGFNSNNMSLDNLIKEDYLDGIVSYPSIENNVNIERQNISVLESFFRINQIDNTEKFSTYDNGFYVIDDQTVGLRHK